MTDLDPRDPNRCEACGRWFHCAGCFYFHRQDGTCKSPEQMNEAGMFQRPGGRWARVPVPADVPRLVQ